MSAILASLCMLPGNITEHNHNKRASQCRTKSDRSHGRCCIDYPHILSENDQHWRVNRAGSQSVTVAQGYYRVGGAGERFSTAVSVAREPTPILETTSTLSHGGWGVNPQVPWNDHQNNMLQYTHYCDTSPWVTANPATTSQQTTQSRAQSTASANSAYS